MNATNTSPRPGPEGSRALLPLPLRQAAAPTGEEFLLDARTRLAAGPGAEDVARWLRATVGAATGLPLDPPDSGGPGGTDRVPASRTIRLGLDEQAGAERGPESYRLDIGADAVTLLGGGPAGLFWGAQTLRQLLGPEACRRAPLPRAGDRAWALPGGVIEDAPRFRWRGLMLDVARHFLPKDGVLRYIDLMAAHKLNVLQLHLTDDQGWRVEIKRYPRLTGTGGWRERSRLGLQGSTLWDERPHGGYYTQDDLREIVAYAAVRHITVVPEIDVPAHSQAAVAAHPELGVTDVVDTGDLRVWTEWGLSPNVLNPSEETIRFYEHVLEEILEIFPGPYVHIGADECPMGQWRESAAVQLRIEELGLDDEISLQHWLVRHFAEWLTERGRTPAGWDEIMDRRAPRSGAGALASSWAEAGEGFGAVSGAVRADVGAQHSAPGARDLPEDTVVLSWRGFAGGVAAARAGHAAVMCPEEHLYLDHRQAAEGEPVPIGYVRTLADVYRFEPVPAELSEEEARRVAGAQGNAWTEAMDSPQRLDYQVFPRLAALAEVTWSHLPPPAERDLADFEARMAGHYERLDAMGVDYRRPEGPRPWERRPGVPGRPMG
ncbi:beta-N-acetylhexosaminidase [Streptomyces sp. NBC_01497]|uniref:beta-N-acetylhexosaminidase n=1 Tax=Streptomyces sp. NBC_01497 TaxID=2903885 RepID=UPI002E360C22|nr:beta-N-acetylhexosaminidase [Streptomyces sp. NBC_01497]